MCLYLLVLNVLNSDSVKCFENRKQPKLNNFNEKVKIITKIWRKNFALKVLAQNFQPSFYKKKSMNKSYVPSSKVQQKDVNK